MVNLHTLAQQSFSKHLAVFCLTITVGNLLSVHSTHAQTVIFREDFEDADVPANMVFEHPECRTDIGGGTREIRDGSYFMRAEALGHINTRITGLQAPHSIEARVRLSSIPSNSGMFISVGVADPCGETGYWGGTFIGGGPAVGAFAGNQVFNDFTRGNGSSVNLLEWFEIRLDVESEQLSLWVWDSDEAPSESPNAIYATDRFDIGQLPDVYFEWNAPNEGNQPWLELDYIQVSTVPEPSGISLATGSLLGCIAVIRRRRADCRCR